GVKGRSATPPLPNPACALPVGASSSTAGASVKPAPESVTSSYASRTDPVGVSVNPTAGLLAAEDSPLLVRRPPLPNELSGEPEGVRRSSRSGPSPRPGAVIGSLT